MGLAHHGAEAPGSGTERESSRRSRGLPPHVRDHRNEISQNPDLKDADHSATFVANEFSIFPGHSDHDATAAISAGRFVGDNWESDF